MKKLLIALVVCVVLVGSVSALLSDGGKRLPGLDGVVIGGGKNLPIETSIVNEPDEGIIIWSMQEINEFRIIL